MKNEEEVPKHRRKEGKKKFHVKCRLTQEGFDIKMKRKKEELLKDMEWHTHWSNYEKRKHAQNAADNLNKLKSNTTNSWYNPYEGMEYSVEDDDV
jgi:hypothetical protein